MQDTQEPTPEEDTARKKGKRRRRFWLLWLPMAFMGLLALPVVVAELTTFALSHGHCHSSPEDCPEGSVGLVLGCSKYLSKGYRNYFFLGRMEAAAKLWKSGRVSHLIVSGDNSSRYYNEPKDMKEALIQLGVPADRIVCDYAGLRTYDSVVRAKDIFNADKLIIVSQFEHVHRAVAIARFRGMEAEGLNAPLRISRSSRLKQALRERGARIAMVIDFIIDREPKHKGEKAPITTDPAQH